MHLWGGKLRRVPETFQWPDGTPQHIFNLWFLGNAEEKHPPYCYLTPDDMPNKNARKRLSDARYLIDMMETPLRDSGMDFEMPVGVHRVSELFAVARQAISNVVDTNTRHNRPHQLGWRTVVNLLRKGQVRVAVKECSRFGRW
jgi:hypothetical protein